MATYIMLLCKHQPRLRDWLDDKLKSQFHREGHEMEQMLCKFPKFKAHQLDYSILCI